MCKHGIIEGLYPTSGNGEEVFATLRLNDVSLRRLRAAADNTVSVVRAMRDGLVVDLVTSDQVDKKQARALALAFEREVRRIGAQRKVLAHKRARH